MSTNEKINAILDAISQDIEKHKEKSAQAMLTLEHMNVTEEEYKNANLCFGLSQFAAGYLTHIKESLTGADVKAAETCIRFHAHYQRTKGNLTDGSNISIGQAAVATILDGYISKFFDA